MSKYVDYQTLKLYRINFNEKVETINKYLSAESFKTDQHDKKYHVDPLINLDDLKLQLAQLEAVIKEIKKIKGREEF